MPELPEVETTLRGISPFLLNKKIKHIQVRQPKLRWPVPEELHQAENQTVRSLHRRGKYIVAGTKSGSIILHLGMSGSLRIADKDALAQSYGPAVLHPIIHCWRISDQSPLAMRSTANIFSGTRVRKKWPLKTSL